MKKAKTNEEKIQHEINYISFLRKQIEWHSKQEPQDKNKLKELKCKLSKALLVVKILRYN